MICSRFHYKSLILVMFAFLTSACHASHDNIKSDTLSLAGQNGLLVRVFPYPIQAGEILLTISYPNISTDSDIVHIGATRASDKQEITTKMVRANRISGSELTAIIELHEPGLWILEITAETEQSTLHDFFEISVSPAPKLALQTAENFEAKNVNGNSVKLSDFAGKPVVLNFWATWCPSCRSEMPLLEEMHKVHSEHDVVVLGINVEETRDEVLTFAKELELTFPLLLDPTGVIADSYHARVLPLTVFISPDGYVVYKHFGILTQRVLTNGASESQAKIGNRKRDKPRFIRFNPIPLHQNIEKSHCPPNTALEI